MGFPHLQQWLAPCQQLKPLRCPKPHSFRKPLLQEVTFVGKKILLQYIQAQKNRRTDWSRRFP